METISNNNYYKSLFRYETYYFLVGWILMLINTSLYYSNIGELKIPVLSLTSIICFGLKYLTSHFTVKEFIKVVVINIIGFIVFIKSHETRILWFTIVIGASKNVKIREVAKYTFYTLLVCVVFYITLFLMGVIPETTTLKGGHSLGLGHPNSMHLYLTLLIILFLFLNFDQFNYKYFIIFNILNIIVYFISQSRSGAFTLFTILLYPMMLSLLKQIYMKRIFSIIFLSSIGILILFVILATFTYNESPLFKYLNTILTGRLYQANFYFKNFGASLFGHYLEYLNDPNAVAILDIGYSKLLINNGVISLLMFVIGYIKVLYKSLKLNKFNIILLVSTTLIHLLIENTMTYIFMNISLLYFGCLLFNKEIDFI